MTGRPADREGLSIVFVNYRSSDDLRHCLKSIFRHNACAEEYEFIVVDNNSGDDGLEQLKKEYPQARIFAAEKNGGFAYGNNIGVRNSTMDYVLLLNPDTFVDDNSIHRMHTRLKTDSSVDLIGPKMLFPDGRNFSCYEPKSYPTLWRIFCEKAYLNVLFRKSRLFNSYFRTYMDYDRETRVEQLSGAALMFRRGILEKTGYMDENYFLYFEESDFCYQAAISGLGLLYYPDAHIYHVGGLITEIQWELTTRHNTESFVYYFRKNFSPLHCRAAKVFFFTGSLVRTILLFLTGNRKYRYHLLYTLRILKAGRCGGDRPPSKRGEE